MIAPMDHAHETCLPNALTAEEAPAASRPMYSCQLQGPMPCRAWVSVLLKCCRLPSCSHTRRVASDEKHASRMLLYLRCCSLGQQWLLWGCSATLVQTMLCTAPVCYYETAHAAHTARYAAAKLHRQLQQPCAANVLPCAWCRRPLCCTSMHPASCL